MLKRVKVWIIDFFYFYCQYDLGICYEVSGRVEISTKPRELCVLENETAVGQAKGLRRNFHRAGRREPWHCFPMCVCLFSHL